MERRSATVLIPWESLSLRFQAIPEARDARLIFVMDVGSREAWVSLHWYSMLL